MTFKPFKKLLNELSTEDLETLVDRHIAEGLFIEYKREFPSNDKIGHSISSFANTYGGTYIVGVESHQQTNEATRIVGIDLTKDPDPISKVREVAKSHIDPCPAFSSRLIRIAEDQGVLVVEIPDEQDKPFISRNGRIYRRRADSSDPVAETDRYTIDRLYSEGHKAEELFRRRLELSAEPESNFTKARILITPFPSVDKPSFIGTEEVEKLLDLSKKPRKLPFYSSTIDGHIPFNVGFETPGSIVLRQMSQGSDRPGISLSLLSDGSGIIDMPIQTYPNSEDLRVGLEREVREVLETLHYSWLLLDIGTLSTLICTLVTFYQQWLGENPQTMEFRFACRLSNIQRTIPFLNRSIWADHIHKFGPPICEMGTITFPETKWYPHGVDDGPFSLWQLISVFLGYRLGFTEKLQSEAMLESAIRGGKPIGFKAED